MSMSKKNVVVVPAVDEKVTRAIRKTPEQRELKIIQYLDAAIYNAKKIGNKKFQLALETARKSCE